MDSFCSLFDPSDGHKKNEQESLKKKVDPPKGRRRGRKSQGKNETLPEESSFLCEPNLSTDLLVKDGSYIESYIEVNKPVDSKSDVDKKPKRRNSGRKNRRKKNKVSPLKEFGGATNVGGDEGGEGTAWNNRAGVRAVCDRSVGKNVNDLHAPPDPGYNVIGQLESVTLQDPYCDGDLSNEELDDFMYSSDELDDSFEDSTSEAGESDESEEEVYGSLPPEPRFGNVEYKLQLVAPSEKRFQHLVTQLKWRLASGGGAAVYVVGVRDCGAVRGLRARAMRSSLRTLRRMAAALRARVRAVRARRLAPHRALVEVYIRKVSDAQQNMELRVAVMGANEAGKSTLIGVLTQGELDNGRGSARLNMFRHLHEVKSGRTSSLSHEILGFDAQGNVVNYGCSELMTAERIGERSAKLVSFLDLAGHSKYQRTTLHGLTGYSPHYALLVISATAGVSGITEEHISLLLDLELPFCVVITKCELAPGAVDALVERLALLLAPKDKKPMLISGEAAVRGSVLRDERQRVVGVFPVSCVRGGGLRALHALLHRLPAPPAPPAQPAPHEQCEFQIDEVFQVGAGPVAGGLLANGALHEGDRLLLGPLENGEFVSTRVKSIYRNRVPCGSARAGHSASLGLELPAPAPPLRAGMVLLAVPPHHRPRAAPAPCPRCAQLKDTKSMNKVTNLNYRKNILTQLELNLEKTVEKREDNIYRPAGGEGEACVCSSTVPLEDPNDPRGCIFFQAHIRVVRHATSIAAGFQCTVHVGNVRQTAIIEGVLCGGRGVRAGQAAHAVFRLTRCPEWVPPGRRLLLTAGQGTRAIGRVTQVFPYIP